MTFGSPATRLGHFCAGLESKMASVYASDRGSKKALIWEDSAGRERTYTYNDIRLASNTIGSFLRGLGIKDGERVCLRSGLQEGTDLGGFRRTGTNLHIQ